MHIIIIAVVVSILVATLGILAAILYKCHSLRKEKKAKEKLYSNIYVKLFTQEDAKRRRKELKTLEQAANKPALCQGTLYFRYPLGC